MLTYRLLHLLKFLGVILYAGGLIGSFVATSLPERKRAVHAIASPGLLLTWVTGYLLTTQLNVPLTELWIVGGIGFSLLSQLALVHSVSRDRRTVGAFAFAFGPLFLVLLLMVFRPTWASFAS
ncbi:hypothetical protein [Pendulispora albinea]|uniref:Uncharacterized protein n=1 Tax=Pendulispora albinea TaxID=2741071 RepID=A0ABZ2LVV3_9BACT